jgi:hypothetical protein
MQNMKSLATYLVEKNANFITTCIRVNRRNGNKRTSFSENKMR